ncbi:MAG TPA: tryptophan synthase subunit alpha [Candidatus Omnitrophota bacterium]|nr:tryptophan synthase subunit alpha [Candidatus Omnitrophota bacterium]
MMNRIDKKFLELRRNKQKAFIVFITAGYPNLKTTERLILEFSKGGVDIIELGVPFSDPMADGPIIQEASKFALKKKVRLVDILKLVKRVRRRTEIPICLMTYYNPIFCFGEEKFAAQAKYSGVDGVIIPDLPPEEGISFSKHAKAKGLNLIYFLSPTSTKERIKFISKASQGFIYYVSLTGVTGPRQNLAAGLEKKLKAIKKYTSKPACVGFGVSSAHQVKQINKFADGVIVGSAIVKKIKDNLRAKNLVKRVGNFVRSLNV